ncbi:Esterase B1 [Pseudolycoriella hygida]|uniref:Carboxylic ester hydrolase n=1 Tax=Pseudolycoriella hygida TaxID=35572 RepID=A0A9Q0RVT3_9DIPT|nr:Esterase B1 [Pseudolycoriella hygida]
MTDIVVTTVTGKIKGVKKRSALGDEYLSFQRIPYAKPPINELRFSDPQPVEPWSGVLIGTIPAPCCIQLSSIYNSIVGYEDCLYLNIYTKNLNPDSKAPVMIWIHGGGFMFGSCGPEIYGPDYLLQNNVVLVVTNYRVGVLGFASFTDPAIGIPGNAGLRDQLMAIKWVKENIESFGGDSDNITVFGQSAGANSVHYLMLTDKAKDLFKRGILMSGTAVTSSGLKSKNNYTLRLAEILGWSGSTDEKSALSFLRQQTAEALIMAQDRLIPEKEREQLILFPFGPVIEPYVTENSIIPTDPILMSKTAWSKDLDMIIGGTSDEGLIIYKSLKKRPQILRKPDLSQLMLPADLVADENEPKAKQFALKLNEYYIGSEIVSLDKCDGFLKLMTDKLYLHRIYRTLTLRNECGNGKTYFYRLSVDSPTNNCYKLFHCGTNVKGCSHADDVSYIFKNMSGKVPPRDSMEFRTIQTLVSRFTKFATDGDPNNLESSSVIWKPVNGQTKPYKCLNIVEEGDFFVDFPESDRMALWDSLYIRK